MQRVSLRLLAAVLSSLMLCPAFVAAEERVIEDEIVMSDPTVAAKKRWAAGISGEGWYISGPYNTVDEDNNAVSKGSISGSQLGGNIFVGYGNFSLQYSQRKGRFKIPQTYVGVGARTDETQTQTDREVTLRYLFRVSRHFSPYVIAGYSGIDIHTTEVLQPGFKWTYNNKATYTGDTSYDMFLIGGGAIVPFNKHLGARADVRVMAGSAKFKRDEGIVGGVPKTITGGASGAALTGTLYVNIFKGLNVQAGGKILGIASKNVGGFARYGMFGSLGYNYKF